jgi:hypothetical protein
MRGEAVARRAGLLDEDGVVRFECVFSGLGQSGRGKQEPEFQAACSAKEEHNEG